MANAPMTPMTNQLKCCIFNYCLFPLKCISKFKRELKVEAEESSTLEAWRENAVIGECSNTV